MESRNLAGAFLKYKDEVLLMQRGLHKKLAPGMWAGVGGFIEPSEINSPLSACLREIKEETGIGREWIAHIELKYITIQNTEGIIESIYYFIGDLTHRCEFSDTDEGTLHWVPISRLSQLPMSLSVSAITERWTRSHDDGIKLCVISGKDEENHWINL